MITSKVLDFHYRNYKSLLVELKLCGMNNRPYPKCRYLVVKRIKLLNMAILLNVFRTLSGQNIT